MDGHEEEAISANEELMYV